ncbi:WhiB family transcriptional regulator [Streptomyces sp. JW3]|uniref:WhiB family transcriptional regulator n=1 Tax=Streptomyces sp. JW3 TaxID=3456955 RepID=UPI003FA42E18
MFLGDFMDLAPNTTPGHAWTASAACVGLPPEAVFARRPAQAAPALAACARCPVVQLCEQTVAPADTWFDGVCAGRLWHNGRPVALDRGRRRRTAAA